MSSMLKAIAALAIVTLATLAVLVVFDILPLAVLGAYAGRLALTACILALATAALTLLMRSGRS
jgi:hypothetical protein